MGPIRGIKRRKKKKAATAAAEREVDQNAGLPPLPCQPHALDWWDDFSKRITAKMKGTEGWEGILVVELTMTDGRDNNGVVTEEIMRMSVVATAYDGNDGFTFTGYVGGAALPPANPAISEPVFPTPFNSMENFLILAIPSLLGQSGP
ncbi:hypothetical protein U1Q18_022118 [Sarracenia purpurea var. burkii]